MKILVTGSNGLIGGAAVEYFDSLGHEVYGADNNWRAKFFGQAGDTNWNRHRIFHNCKNYHPNDTDITNEDDVWSLFHRGSERPVLFQYDAVIHCAAQPSHDFATANPELDYKVNVLGTKNLLEAVRKFSPNAVFVFMSTNKVYDDFVNSGARNIFESAPVGASSPFGQHKLEADLMVQRYAKEYGIKTVVLRGGCLTGPGHSGVPQHGFLNYLIRCAVTGTKYQVHGYNGEQIRDNIHSYDVVTAIDEIIKNSKPGEVYNIGGGLENSISVRRAIEKAEKFTGKKMDVEYLDMPRKDDHVCYITNMTKFRHDYPNWKMTKSLDDIFSETFKQYYWGAYSDHEDTKTYDLNENSLVFDVGGYRGAFTASILEKYNPQIDIFEPVKEFFEDCVRRFASGHNVIVHRFGFSNKDSKVTLAKQGMNSSVFRGNDGQEPLPIDAVYGAAKSEEIVLLDISKYLTNTDVKNVDLISINCEGGEYDILLRLIETGQIKIFNNVQVQFHDFHPNAVELRDKIRNLLANTHVERFNYPFVWESWRRK